MNGNGALTTLSSRRPVLPLARTRQFEPVGLDRKCWSTAAPIRAIFREAFTAAGLPYFNPHSFRKTLVRLGEQLCRTPEDFKAWSQNLGHEQVLTTFTSYGQVARDRQYDIIRSALREPPERCPRKRWRPWFAKWWCLPNRASIEGKSRELLNAPFVGRLGIALRQNADLDSGNAWRLLSVSSRVRS